MASGIAVVSLLGDTGFLFGLLASLAAVELSYRLIESPALTLKQRLNDSGHFGYDLPVHDLAVKDALGENAVDWNALPEAEAAS